jgi:hypothetical protein
LCTKQSESPGGAGEVAAVEEALIVERPLTIVTAPQLAKRLGVSRTKVARLVRAGVLRPIAAVGWYYLPADAQLPAPCCAGCGTDLGKVKADRKWCDACRTERRRATQRAYYRRDRRVAQEP